MSIIKRIVFGILITLVGYGFYKLAELYSPGSYPNAETYGFDISEKELLIAVHKFKAEHPEYVPPVRFGLKEGRRSNTDHWYSLYFYYPKSNEIIYVWTRSKGFMGATILGLIRINKGDRLGNWKDINKDFSSSENSAQKEKFEKLILNPIKMKVVNSKE